MPLDYDRLKNWPHPELRHDYTVRDTMLYALGLGAGRDPMDVAELAYVYEDGLKVLPTMAAVICYPGFWLKDPETGLDWQKVLHAEQSIEIYRPLKSAASVTARTVVDDIIDKGEGKGAILYQRRELIDADTGEAIASVRMSSFARGDGGFGGASGPQKEVHQVPDRDPDVVIEFETRPDQALIYRLSGDYNPLHADPAVAQAAGFERPILHGLCTFGIAGRAVVKGLCDDQPEKLRRIDCRFSAPVIPGDTIRTELWTADADGKASFRCSNAASGKVVLNNGLVMLF